jgi:hypothetical protein
VKSFKALADGKDVFIGTKMGSGIFVYISSITCDGKNAHKSTTLAINKGNAVDTRLKC